MLSIIEALALSKKLASCTDSPRIDCEVILSAAIEQSRTYLYTWPEKTLSDHQQTIFLQNLERRINGEPVAYIVGQKEFWSLPLFVDKSTLIPRPETELVVEVTLELLSDAASVNAGSCKNSFIGGASDIKIADLGTGSGAIALALASENPHWQVWGLERDKGALALAKKNQQQLNLSNVNLLLSDWFSALSVKGSTQKSAQESATDSVKESTQEPDPKFNAIVSNPPYIDVNDKHLQQGDVRFEPHTALVADDHGLADIESIISQASEHLLQNGWLVFEHGNQQADAVTECFKKHGFQCVFTRNDLAGQPRVTSGQLR
jgi:release factor glutamine methyltransferase